MWNRGDVLIVVGNAERFGLNTAPFYIHHHYALGTEVVILDNHETSVECRQVYGKLSQHVSNAHLSLPNYPAAQRIIGKGVFHAA